MNKIELIATTPFGLESVVAREIKQLGYEEITVDIGKVTFAGDEKAICRSNLWLRTADRVLVKMGEFQATTFEELFEQTKALAWENWLPEDAAFPVEGRSVKSMLSSVPACQGIVKKAIVEKLKETYKREWFDETGPQYSIEVSIHKDVATLTIDTSGAGLHKRGYRKLSAEAPLKETLAAAIVLLSRWTPDRPLYDPFCGSGTIPIEAAMIGKNIAPGLQREFDAQFWPTIHEKLWQEAEDEAFDLANNQQELSIFGSDIDSNAIAMAQTHANIAGLKHDIRWQVQPVSNLQLDQKYGCLIGNPPYGERLGEMREIEALYRQFGSIIKTSVDPTWSVFILTSHPEFERLFGKRSDKKRKLYNGRIQCNLYQYFGPFPPRGSKNS
ncbi:class I SAM-dependent RNA methyltransferase [Fodinisporobacter ferrooxydans]|uniref:Class I SAM-dependent RNA methyltransferase n=1 Tax=Fodinisporobacter ferrooxydans TaxID=2901836 RepID=A0ABY4CIL6_9BACL|nr:class I SAM-dependent RNA methyltransferase [Alicyclobacillaceae bacterium MYW30-H2]